MTAPRRQRPRGHRSATPIDDPERLVASRAGSLLETWWRDHGRSFPWREWTDPYRLVVVEILLQRTRAPVVAAFSEHFFEHYPSWHSLARASRGDLEELLAPLGLQRRRAASLIDLATHAQDGLDLDDDLPGVGQYVDRAVRVAVNGARVAMVDSNFVRVLRRVFAGPWQSDYRYDPRLQELAQAIVTGGKDPRHVNWAVLDLGSGTCTPRNPRCGECPLAGACAYAADRAHEETPTASSGQP